MGWINDSTEVVGALQEDFDLLVEEAELFLPSHFDPVSPDEAQGGHADSEMAHGGSPWKLGASAFPLEPGCSSCLGAT